MSGDIPKFTSGVCRQRHKGKLSPCWYGRRRLPGEGWKWVKLCANRREAERMWEGMKLDAEKIASGALTPAARRLRDTPIETLADEYRGALVASLHTPESVRIADWMVRRLIALGGWTFYRDITRGSMESILRGLADVTASHRNNFLRRARAFAAHFLPDDEHHPLRKVNRVRERDAKQTRGRRAATAAELSALFALPTNDRGAMPPSNRLAYALAAYNGLRRNEAARLTWADVRADSAIPCLSVRRKNTATAARDLVPVHPYVMELLQEIRRCSTRCETTSPTAPDADAAHSPITSITSGPSKTSILSATDAAESSTLTLKVLPRVPDVQTLRRQWARAGVPFKDDAGRRLDYHALRHTFATRLEHAGVSRATVKALMRHSRQGVTEGYIHAEIEEMAAALARLPSPVIPQVTPAEQPAQTPAERDSTQRRQVRHPLSPKIPLTEVADITQTSGGYPVVSNDLEPVVYGGGGFALNFGESPFIIAPSGPSTQVGQGRPQKSPRKTRKTRRRSTQFRHGKEADETPTTVGVSRPYAPGSRRYVNFRSHVLTRVPRPIRTPVAEAQRRTVRRLLARAERGRA